MARVSQLVDVLNKLTIDALISPRSCGERNLASHHIKHIDSNTLILLDRGCPAFWLFALIFAQGANFCARIAITWWHPVRKFLDPNSICAPGRQVYTEEEMNAVPEQESAAINRMITLHELEPINLNKGKT